jgi:hypothetical protein
MQPVQVPEFSSRLYLLFPQGSHTRSALVKQSDVRFCVRVHCVQVAQVFSLALAYFPEVHA